MTAPDTSAAPASPVAPHVVVVGNGPVAHRFVERLRQHGHRGAVTVLGAEPEPAYHRALLTSVLDGTLPPGALRLPDPPAGVRLRTGVTVTRIDRRRRLVHTDDGAAYRYTTLVLATGARPALPAIPGLPVGSAAAADGVVPLRTLADCARVTGSRMVVIGGGPLAVEAAAALRRAGHEVALVHRGPHLLDRRVDSTAGALLGRDLDRLGIELHLGRTATAYLTGKVILDDGVHLMADSLLLCTGAVPETGLARRAGLTVRSGVVVDDRLRTDDPYVHAIGDCAEHPGDQAGQLDSGWQQAETLARLLTGAEARHHGTPRVTRLRVPGIALVCLGRRSGETGADGTETTAPADGAEVFGFSDPARGRYARLVLRGGRITEAVLLGLPRAIAAVSRLYERGLPVPTGRLELLLGAAPSAAGPEALPDDAVICRCNNVTKHTLTEAWRGGARELSALAETTRATTGCGTCTDTVRALCRTRRQAVGPGVHTAGAL